MYNGLILLIDDDRLLLDSMDGILRRAGLTVVARDSAADAVVDLVRDGRFDLILTDLSMSDLDGVAFFGLVRRLRPDLVGRVIFVTGGALTARAKSLLDERPDQVLHKPFSRTSLLEAVARFGREA